MSDKTYTIKPLEWQKDISAGIENPNYLFTSTPLGGYEIEYRPDFGWWEIEYILGGERGGLPECRTTLEDTKQQVKDHWEGWLMEKLKGVLEEQS